MISPAFPNVGDRDNFTVMQCCRLLGITRTTLAKYDRLNYIHSHMRFDGRKAYTGKAIKDFYVKIKNS